MARLSEEQVAALWVKHGGDPAEMGMAVAVANHESSRRTDAQGPIVPATGQRARGLMQIHPNGSFDPDENMKQAVAKWRASGWTPWSVCGTGPWSSGTRDCARLRPEAERIQRRLERKGVTQNAGLFDLNPLDPFGEHGPLNPDPLGPNLDINPVDDIVGAVKFVGDALKKIAEVIVNWSNKLADPNTWKDAGKIMLGIILLLMGLKGLFELRR